MAVTKRGSRWQAGLYDHHGKRVRRDFPTREEAEAWHALALSNREKGLPFPPSSAVSQPEASEQPPSGRHQDTSLEAVFSLVIRSRPSWRDGKDQQGPAKNIGYAMRYFGRDRRLETIEGADLKAYVQRMMEDGNGAATINRKLSHLRVLFTEAAEWGLIPTVPRFPPHQKEPKGRERVLSQEEVELLHGALLAHGYEQTADAVLVLVSHGLRPSELGYLRKWHVDLRRQSLHVPDSKTGTGRVLPLFAPGDEVLRRLAKTPEAVAGGALFPRLDRYKLARHVNRARLSVGLDEAVTPYALRHTFASNCLDQWDIAEVQVMMGHTNIITTRRYVHRNPTGLLEKAKRLSRERLDAGKAGQREEA